MGSYLIRRLAISAVVLVAVSMVVFAAINAAPGDPVDAMIDPNRLGSGNVEQLRKSLGLDQPMPVRYLQWVGQLAQGNLGYSYRDHRQVLVKIEERLGATLKLAGAALLLSVLLGVPLGILAAVRSNTLLDRLIAIASFVPISVPSFFLGLGLIYVFALRLRVLPLAGDQPIHGGGTALESLRYLLLPAVMLGAQHVGVLTRYVRAAVLEVRRDPYVTTARAKGLRESVIVIRHVIPNALIPVITVLALMLPGLLGGAVLTEQVFQWPGLGKLTLEAVQSRDYPTLMGLSLVAAVLVLFFNLLADLLYAVVDPRIRLAR